MEVIYEPPGKAYIQDSDNKTICTMRVRSSRNLVEIDERLQVLGWARCEDWRPLMADLQHARITHP